MCSRFIRDDELTLTQNLAAYYSRLSYSELPPDVTMRAKLGILDTVGTALYGVSSEEAKYARIAAQDLTQNQNATIWGTDQRSSMQLAAVVNSVSAAATELDDIGNGHNGAVVVPAVLAVAEHLKCSGEQVLVAVVVGYEIARRILDGAGGYNQHNGLGWHGTGTVGSFGSAAAIARLLNLDPEQMVSALGIAGSFTGGTWAFMQDGTMTKRLHPGKAAENGIGAAFLARAGYSGPAEILEAEWGGFYNTYDQSGGSDPQEVLRDVGEEFHILRSGFKRHACCAGIHNAIDALLGVFQSHRLSHDQISRLEVVVSSYSKRHLGKQIVRTTCDAQLSLPFGLSVTLLSGGKTGPDLFAMNYVNDPAVQSWCNKIELKVDETLEPNSPHTVYVHCHDGRIIIGQNEIPKGEPENPLSLSEILDKYLDLANRTLELGSAKKFSECVFSLEKCKSISDPIALLQS
jgi:2-methylcitrate dehydratase PrpD